MDNTTKDLLNMSFRRKIPNTPEEFTFNTDMLKIFLQINADKTLTQVAKDAETNPTALKHNITKLMNLGLIEALGVEINILDQNFFNVLKNALRLAVGPMADVILEDALADLEASVSNFPAHMAAGLINNLAEEVPREEQRAEFQKTMVNLIPK